MHSADLSLWSRLFQILPQRIQHWQAASSIAEENNRNILEAIRENQQEAKNHLVQLDLRHKNLDALIERAKNATIDPDAEVLASISSFLQSFVGLN